MAQKRLIVPQLKRSSANSEVLEQMISSLHGSQDTDSVSAELQFQCVDEIWDTTTSRYRTIEIPLPPEAEEQDQYLFVVRCRTGRSTESQHFLDIKSEPLNRVLKTVLSGVRAVAMEEKTLTIERNLLFHYRDELVKEKTEYSYVELQHLKVLLQHLSETFDTSYSQRRACLESGEISFDLLWTIFKPGDPIYTTILDVETPACFVFESGHMSTTRLGVLYYHIKCRGLDFNGEVFVEIVTALGIRSFSGLKQIDSLEAFPLSLHSDCQNVRKHLIRCSRRSTKLVGKHLVAYNGDAFSYNDGEYRKVPVDGRIMVDTVLFREQNPNYTKPRVNSLVRQNGPAAIFADIVCGEEAAKGLDGNALTENELMICSQTVSSWSFDDKKWLEFVVDDIRQVSWVPSSFDNLEIPAAHKRVILALANFQVSTQRKNDIARGKGREVIILLHGPPGTGKTRTAESLSEKMARPLCIVTSGELGQNAMQVEAGLKRIFRLAESWNAIVLFAEADAFVQSRSSQGFQNELVSVFLRMLEYFHGIMFLAINKIQDFDEAIMSRVSVPLNYDALSMKTQRSLWTSSLEPIGAGFTAAFLDDLAKKDFNGRQIRGTIESAQAIATGEGVDVDMEILSIVVDLQKNFETLRKGAVQSNTDAEFRRLF